jgi:hypothetical protein
LLVAVAAERSCSILPTAIPRLPAPQLSFRPADNTLVDAVSCTIAPSDWDLLDWRHVVVTNSYGRQMAAQYAPLPGHDDFSGAPRPWQACGRWLGLVAGCCCPWPGAGWRFS